MTAWKPNKLIGSYLKTTASNLNIAKCCGSCHYLDEDNHCIKHRQAPNKRKVTKDYVKRLQVEEWFICDRWKLAEHIEDEFS